MEFSPHNFEAERTRIRNEGHALDRHGESVTDDELFLRAETGVAPDGGVRFHNKTDRAIIPPMSSAFDSDEMLVFSDQFVRDNYLDRALTLKPNHGGKITIQVDVGVSLGRGVPRAGSSRYDPNNPPPNIMMRGLTSVSATYTLDVSTGRWRTTTIYPTK